MVVFQALCLAIHARNDERMAEGMPALTEMHLTPETFDALESEIKSGELAYMMVPDPTVTETKLLGVRLIRIGDE